MAVIGNAASFSCKLKYPIVTASNVGACCEFMHFRCDNVWKRLAEAARETPESGESSFEGASKKHSVPNVLMAVPTIYSKMIEAAEHNVLEPGIVDDAVKTLSDMRLMISGSAALPVSLNAKWKNLTGHTLLEVSTSKRVQSDADIFSDVNCKLYITNSEVWNDW